MRCKYCNIEVPCEAKLCPLCHEKLVEDEIGQKTDTCPKKAYPDKVPRTSGKKRFTFTNIYFLASLVLFLISVAVCMLVTPKIQWFWLVGLILLYIYLLVRNTIKSSFSVALKIILQAVMIFLMLWAVDGIVRRALDANATAAPPFDWVFDFALPTLICVTIVVMSSITCVSIKKDPSLIVDTLLISLLGYLPLILYAAHLIETLFFAIACAILCTAAIAACVIFGRRELGEQFKRKFHL